jgi:hypothetical protein
MIPLRASRKFFAILGLALGVAVGVCLLPERPYERWQLLDNTLQSKTRWIYERIHYDPRPIDVVVVGPSRTVRGVDSRRLEANLKDLGVSAHVANFALPQGGRDLNDAIVEDMFTAKRPKLIVIGVIEKPSRFGHAAFKYIAPRGLLADPGYPTNLNYLSNLAYLPFRQMRLFAAYVFPGAFGLSDTFQPDRYSADQTEDIIFTPDGGTPRPASQAAPFAELEAGAERLTAGTRPPILPRSLADFEFGDERHYIRRIVAAAQAHGVKVAFLFLPYYTGPATIQEQDFYAQYGPVWNAGFVADHPELYSDYAHLTTEGAARVNAWIAPSVAKLITDPTSAK